ncbi:immune inhibitor A domain-containing protein [Macrococcus carouselicus]|uniref:M6 family metalloprotease domain-containing protein n=1 Tax=Macrococcus carouselicus TaxID=69969 RepID=A0A9Q8CMM5_9STAP|nr:immune inhibitor A domain-containing protein [Macrococcus carouselicus]TDM03615.1 M6 family metalloprotease domain-containing protein [Macrococcus carouselicus]
MKKMMMTLAAILLASQTYGADAAEKVKPNEDIVHKKNLLPTFGIPAFKARDYNGKVMKENVLIVMMDFTDSRRSTLKPGNGQFLPGTDASRNYYKTYNQSYYRDLFFADHFKGSDGRQYRSVKKYFEESSGNSFTLSGQVSGWYRAKKPLSYYGADDDSRVHELIMEAAYQASKDPKINLSRYDRFDYYDRDNDGKINEPDGIIDKIVVVFSGIGESEGGGRLGENSIWEHVSQVGSRPKAIPGTYSRYSKYPKHRMMIGEYGVMAEDSTVGTFTHEFGHLLGLIDEYDTASSAAGHAGEPVRFWSLMSYGADAGKKTGSKPVGMSPFAKSDLQMMYGGNWLRGAEISSTALSERGKTYLVDQASMKGHNNDVIKINLPSVTKKLKNGRYKKCERYYLVEWRSHKGIDAGLSEIYDPFGRNYYGKGMLIWYVNEYYDDNSNLVRHPGRSLVGVIDASPKIMTSQTGNAPTTDIQVYDAPFNTKSYGNYNKGDNYFFKKADTKPITTFHDRNYTQARLNQSMLPEAGRVLPQEGIKIKVVGQNKEGTVAKIKVYK